MYKKSSIVVQVQHERRGGHIYTTQVHICGCTARSQLSACCDIQTRRQTFQWRLKCVWNSKNTYSRILYIPQVVVLGSKLYWLCDEEQKQTSHPVSNVNKWMNVQYPNLLVCVCVHRFGPLVSKFHCPSKICESHVMHYFHPIFLYTFFFSACVCYCVSLYILHITK